MYGRHDALDPRVDPYALGPGDAVHLANAAFGNGGLEIGVVLYPGMGELDLSHLYDTYAYTTVGHLVAIAADDRVVVSAHGLTFVPSGRAADAGRLGLDRVIASGLDARAGAAVVTATLASAAPDLRPEYPHAGAPERFGLEPVIEDLARTADRPTARFALRRLEYRSSSLRLEGSAVPWRPLGSALALALVGLVTAAALTLKRWRSPRIPG